MKAIFMTDGGSGIGRATARLFADRGWRVGLADVNEAGLRETAAPLPAGLAETYVMDVRDRDAWAAVHGNTVHTYVGRTAHRLRFAARWMPGRLRRSMRR